MSNYSDSECSENADSVLDDQQALSDFLSRPLQFRRRPPMTVNQKVFSGVFYGQLVLQLVASVVLMASVNVMRPDANEECPSGWRKDGFRCTTAALYQKKQACVPEETLRPLEGIRRLSDESTRNMWEMLADNIALPLVVALLAFSACCAWFFMLRTHAGWVTWGTFACNIALMIYGFYLTKNWMLLVVALVVIALAVVGRDEMKTAIQAMRVAAEALQVSPGVFPVCAAIQLVWVVYGLCFFFTGIYFGVQSLDVNPKTCAATDLSPAAKFYWGVVGCLFIITTWFLKNCILATCALAVGCWYFPDEKPPSNPAILGVRLALTTSSGSVFGASLIMGLVEYVRRQTRRTPCWWCDPAACLVRALWCVLEGLVGSLTRFALIGHLFRGEGLCWVARLTYGALQRQLPGACMTGIVSEKVMSQISMMLATGIGFAVWFYLDAKEGLQIFSNVHELSRSADQWFENGNQWVIVGITLLMLYCVRHPLVTILVTLLFQADGSIMDDWTNSFSISILSAAIVAVIFQYFGSIMEYSTDAAFFCFALEAEAGKRQARMVKLYSVMEKRGADKPEFTQVAPVQ